MLDRLRHRGRTGSSEPINIAAQDAVALYTDHTHSTPAHGQGLTYGIFKETMPGSINVNLGLWRKPLAGGSWTLLGSISGLDETEQWVDMQSLLPAGDPSGLYSLTFQSAAGQPNGGPDGRRGP